MEKQPSIVKRLLRRVPRVNIVRLQGMIAADGRGRLSDAAVAPLLERAFKSGKPKAVALIINSPGGSPVQSALIGARIRRLAAETELPVHAFVEDAAASGGYWIASAADDIRVDAASIVGSIGVISAGFGLQDAIGKLGIERRVHTAGRSKSQMDPFQPERPEDVARLDALLEQMHGVFIDHVKTRRGDRLSSEDELFDGSFWLGAEAVRLGLADGLGHPVPVLKDLYGKEVRFRVFGPRRRLISRLGLSLADSALGGIEEAALWARLGV
ncbi:S49 family peptidase [Pararhodobacter oceanensis]|uniref:S49 family peptidase n=1 Tax=Pararhodobacter oceanensis TaxID=2172121 RepID=A0A2T8HYG9_9RHOB|nr:S49 family peptidase [Pararhodobacter oceanensis]PVH30478.1 S49 family peptidase [Pararhodobacter oceanensis]